MSALKIDVAIGEPEQDANTTFIELDQALRSKNIGEQCEAVARFPRLFEKYPFPILINSSFLKLAEVFRRTDNNFLRLCVLRVCQQSEKHLDKILNVEEFAGRVFSLMNSNDPVAKALTLRTLGSIARIIPEKKQVHHCVNVSLDSCDPVQVEAAVYAARTFAAQSKVFAKLTCNKITGMIRGQATPASMKLKLIPILRYMHHDASTATAASGLCKELLDNYPAVDFVRLTLTTCTSLASAVLVQVPDQVALLLDHLRKDPRLAVKMHALHLLQDLAKKSHLWPQKALDQLIDYTSTLLKYGSTNVALPIRCLKVIRVLCDGPMVLEANTQDASPLVLLCSTASYSPNLAVAVVALAILTRVAIHCYEEGLPVYDVESAVTCLESLIVLLAWDTGEKSLGELGVCLKLAVDLCRAHHCHRKSLVETIGTTLANLTSSGAERHRAKACKLCEALGAIGSLGGDVLLPLLPDILGRIEERSVGIHARTRTMLCTLLFQIVASGYGWGGPSEVTSALDSALAVLDPWSVYRVGRSAARYGHHGIARRLFGSLQGAVALEQFHFWLSGLELMSKAECHLSGDSSAVTGGVGRGKVERLSGAVAWYSEACAAFDASSTPLRSSRFACEYARLRRAFLQGLLQLLHSCRALSTAPQCSRLLHDGAATDRDPLLKYGRVTSELRKSMAELRSCADNYRKLQRSAFDADPGTLTNLRALKKLCLLMTQSVQRVCTTTDAPDIWEEDAKAMSLEEQQVSRCCAQLRQLMPTPNEPTGGDSSTEHFGISRRRVGQLLAQLELLTSEQHQFPVPRYFFQQLRSTSIALSMAPQSRAFGEPLCVPHASQLALKVEGVLRSTGNRASTRSVSAVRVTVSTTRVIAPNSTSKKLQDTLGELEQTVVPLRDFFACEFLVSFAAFSYSSSVRSQCLCQVTARASVVDENGNSWDCGARSSLMVKVFKEPLAKCKKLIPSQNGRAWK